MFKIFDLRIYLVLLILFSPGIGEAKKIRKDPMTLYDYIQVKCAKNCVDAYESYRAVKSISEEFKVDMYVLLAIMRVESAFSVTAKNGSNTGLMQINLRFHKPKFPNSNYTNVRENIRVGAIVYRDCLKRSKGSVDKALTCYNGNADPKYSSKVRKSVRELKALAVLL